MSVVRKTLVLNTILDHQFDGGSNPYKFVLKPPIKGTVSSKRIVLALEKAIIPNLAYTFPYYYNTLYLHDPYGGLFKLTVDTKRFFRNGTELATYLSTVTSPYLSWSFNVTTQRLTFTNISGVAGYWLESWYERNNEDPTYASNVIHRLGFIQDLKGLGNGLANGASVEADNPIRLQRTSCYFIAFNDCRTDDDYRCVDPSWSNPGVMAMVPANEFGKLSIVKLDPAPRMAFSANQVFSISLSILDDEYHPIDVGFQPAIFEFSYIVEE